MMSTISKRPVALVTGAAHRVGKALAVGLAENGYDIALHFHSSAGKVEGAVNEIARAGGRAMLFQGDLTTGEAPANWCAT